MRIIKLMVLFILGIALTNCSKNDDSLNDDDSLNSEERIQVGLTTDFLSDELWSVESITSPNGKFSQYDISNLYKMVENFRFRFDGDTLYTLNREETDTLEIQTISIEGNAITFEESNIIDYNGLGYNRLVNVKALQDNWSRKFSKRIYARSLGA